MRKFTLLTLALAAPALAAGCSCGNGNGNGGLDPDASVQPDGETVGETASVTVTDLDQPLEGIDVVFHGPDGSVLDHVRTGADGVASGEMVAGGMITVATAEDGTFFRNHTIGDVRPGDDIQVRDFLGGDLSERIATVSYPGVFATAAGYQVANGCGEKQSTLPEDTELEVDPSCHVTGGTDFHVAAHALDLNGIAIAHSIARDNAGLAVTLPDWSSDFSSIAISAVNAPASAGLVGLTALFMLDNVVFETPGNEAEPDIIEGSAASTAQVPDVADSAIVGGFIEYELADEVVGFGIHFANDGAIPEQVEIDLTGDFLPPALAGTVDDSDRARPRFSWTVTAIDADMLQLSVLWFTETTLHFWTVVTRGDATEVRLPALPEGLSAHRPTVPADGLFADAVYVDGSFIDWDQARLSGGELSLDDLSPPFTLRATGPEFDSGFAQAPAPAQRFRRPAAAIDWRRPRR